MKNVLPLAWLAALTSIFFMTMGHLGDDSLNWISHQISTYAARSAYDYFITASMLLSAILLISIGILVSRCGVVGHSALTLVIPPLTGAAAAGLLMLSYYEETASSLTTLKASGFWSVRMQSFHDAGLDMFFYSSLLLILILGVLVTFSREKIADKSMGIIITLLSPATYLLLTSAWPKALGINGLAIGLSQRVGLFCLWLAAVIFLVIASKMKHQYQAIQPKPENNYSH